jgi:PAS domain S-box-containing protein
MSIPGLPPLRRPVHRIEGLRAFDYLSLMITHLGRGMAKADVARVCEMLFSTAAEGLVVVDGSGVILMHNPRLGTLFGYADGELIGRPIEDLLPASLRHRHVQHREGYNERPVQRSMGSGMNLKAQRKDGTEMPVEVSLNHFQVDEKRYVMGLVTDISLRRQAEEDLLRTNQELEDRVEQRTIELKQAENSVREALAKERELNALKSRFVSMASHEFRTPLSTIMSSVDLIGRYTEVAADEKVVKHIGRIRSKVRELTAILNEFLSLERIDEGQVPLNPTEFDLVDLCIELLEELRTLAKPGQEITFDHDGEERLVLLDRQMLSNVMTNLLTNAVKYSPEDKVVHLHTQLKSGRLIITVADEGMGIPAEDQPHLFGRFFRGSNALTIQGTGLGLNIVKRYLELLSGTIQFTSRPGHTVFTVELPQRLAQR